MPCLRGDQAARAARPEQTGFNVPVMFIDALEADSKKKWL